MDQKYKLNHNNMLNKLFVLTENITIQNVPDLFKLANLVIIRSKKSK